MSCWRFSFPSSSLSLRFITARSNMDLIISHDIVTSTFVSLISTKLYLYKHVCHHFVNSFTLRYRFQRLNLSLYRKRLAFVVGCDTGDIQGLTSLVRLIFSIDHGHRKPLYWFTVIPEVSMATPQPEILPWRHRYFVPNPNESFLSVAFSNFYSDIISYDDTVCYILMLFIMVFRTTK